MAHVMLFPMFNALYIYISTSRSTCAVSSKAVCCSSLMSCFTCMVLRCVLNDFEMVPVAPIVTGYQFVLIFHIRCICNVSSLCFKIFSACLLITILPPEVRMSLNRHSPFFIITDYDVRFIVREDYVTFHLLIQ